MDLRINNKIKMPILPKAINRVQFSSKFPYNSSQVLKRQILALYEPLNTKKAKTILNNPRTAIDINSPNFILYYKPILAKADTLINRIQLKTQRENCTPIDS